MRIAIIGGGAAGCFAAANISSEKVRDVMLFEKTGRLLQKVKISGGGRCNVTHACFDVPELLTRYPRGKHLLKKSLYHFTPEDTINWFGQRGVSLKTEADGRMFPVTDSSQTIMDCLQREMEQRGVTVQYHKPVDTITKTDDRFSLYFADGSSYQADRVLIACGGFPKDQAYQWIRELGHTVQPPAPSLFTFNLPGHPITDLMGISMPSVKVRISGTKFSERGPLLITHWGMSGPAVLRLSARAARELSLRQYHFNIQVSWLDEAGDEELKGSFARVRQNYGKLQVLRKDPFALPKRLWQFLTARAGIGESTRWGELPAAQQQQLHNRLLYDVYEVKGKTTFKEEFVTCGGVSLSEINAQTMESRIVPGLYFAGEIMDVDGITGGYNFQHAWNSGWIAAMSITLS
jgi:predicted Rossmann fold flavoprotein